MMMLRILIALIPIHVGMGFTQMAVSYYGGDIADHGAAGWVSHTPIGTFIDLDDTQQTEEFGLANLRQMFEILNRLGDAINGLASFGYGFMDEIESDDGLVYQIVMAFRIISVCVWLGMAVAVLYFLFDSNLLTTKTGMAILAFGAGLGSLSALGALF